MASRMPLSRILPLRLPPGSGEPAYALLERLARRCGAASAATFSAGLGLDWNAVMAGRDTDRVAHVAGVDARLLGAATFVVEPASVRLSGEVLARKDWSPAHRRFCRECAAEDEDRTDDPPPRAFRRTWWDLPAIRRCTLHGTDLVRAAPGRGIEVAPALDEIRYPFAGETYVLGRLGFAERRNIELLDQLPLGKVIPLLERCGAMRLHGRWARSDARGMDRRPLLSAGMPVYEGEAAPFRSFLDELVATARPGRLELGPRMAYGRLHAWLAHDERDPAYDPVRDALREHALATMPLRPGQILYGQRIEAPAYRTVAQVCDSTSLEPATVERMLALVGGTPATGPSPIPLYHAADCLRAEELAAASCWSREARERLGLTNEGMASLVKAGCLVPMIRRTGRQAREDRFARRDVDGLATLLLENRPALENVPAGCALLSDAARRGMSSIGAVVRAVMGGRLAPQGILAGRPGISSLVVGIDEVFSLHRTDTPDVPWAEVVSHLGSRRVARALTASGRLGLRRGSCGFRNRHRHEVSREDWSTFRDTFVSASELARQQGSSGAAIVRRLADAGAQPTLPSEVCGGRAFYRRDVASRLLKKDDRGAFPRRPKNRKIPTGTVPPSSTGARRKAS